MSRAIFSALLLQVIELQLPSFFNKFDPRSAAANFYPEKKGRQVHLLCLSRESLNQGRQWSG
ncbi:hypothetical protein N665_1758s0006 [Sinapis alba]|nr:hypothetical protein N665_1758s0006 [Sinapis alba]